MTVTTHDVSKADRLAREAAFHDARFGGDMVRGAQEKYYRAVTHGRAAYEARVRTLSVGKDVLEVGSATGDDLRALTASARSAIGIDISPEAVRQAALAAPANASFLVTNAEDTGLPDASLDFVYGAGIVHHLNVDATASETARLLREGGKALFWEPLGHNAAFAFYRKLTPAARTPDEHPLLRSDIACLERSIGPARIKLYGLATLAAVPFGDGALGRAAHGILAPIDKALLAVPGLRWQAWYALIEATRSPR